MDTGKLRTAAETWPLDESGRMINTTTGEILVVEWRLDTAGYLVSPAGSRVARITERAIYLFDKRFGTGLPFTREHWAAMFASLQTDS